MVEAGALGERLGVAYACHLFVPVALNCPLHLVKVSKQDSGTVRTIFVVYTSKRYAHTLSITRPYPLNRAGQA